VEKEGKKDQSCLPSYFSCSRDFSAALRKKKEGEKKGEEEMLPAARKPTGKRKKKKEKNFGEKEFIPRAPIPEGKKKKKEGKRKKSRVPSCSSCFTLWHAGLPIAEGKKKRVLHEGKEGRG